MTMAVLEEERAPICGESKEVDASDGESERCRVIVRLRPLPEGEKVCHLKVLEGERVLVPGGPSTATPSKATPRKRKGMLDDDPSFQYDKVFGQDCNQTDVFEAVLNNSVSSVLDGFNATVLAYGQTGAGKTYNMFGGEDDESKGIIPRALDELFIRISKDATGSNFEVKLSMTEIYMEELIDLLRPSAYPRLRLRESVFSGVWVEGLNHVGVSSAKAALELVVHGMSNRTVGTTNMNDASSRSHCIVSLRVEKSLPDGLVQTGVLHFADLAGMERVDRTGAQGQTLEEAKRINLSLSALGNCISALSDPTRTHIPFRDSKLTFLLKNSLGGNAKTTLLVACSSRHKDFDETMGALRFAQRARSVKNIVKVNRKLSAQELQRLLDKLQQEHRALQTYCLSLEAQLEGFATGATGPSKENQSPSSPIKNRRASSPMPLRHPQISSIKSPPPMPMSPAMMAAMATPKGLSSSGGEPSPVRSLDPMVLLHRISVLEAERVDMQIEIEALSTFSPPGGVAGTSLSKDAAATFGAGQRLSWGGADLSIQTSMLGDSTPCKHHPCSEAYTQMSPTIVATDAPCCASPPPVQEILRGTLSKRGKSFLGLKRTVGCELTESSLIYNSKQAGVRKEIRLSGIGGCRVMPGGLRFTVDLEGGGRSFQFSAGSEKERERWLGALADRGVGITGR